MGYFTDRLEQEKEGEEKLPPVSRAVPVAPPADEPSGPITGDFFSKRLKEHLGETETANAAKAEESKVTGDTPWSEVLTMGAKNFIPDVATTTGDIATGLYNTVRHPIETGKGLGALAKGTYDYLADNKTPEREVATNLGRELAHDYGTEEGWKRGIAERPFSRALDVGTVMLAPEMALRKLGAEGAAKAVSAVNPATWIEKGAKKAIDIPTRLGSELVGEMGTHTGGWSISLGRQATKESAEMGAAYKAGQKSKATLGDMVGGFEETMDEFKNIGHREYRADKNALRSDSQRLSFDPVMQALKNSRSKFIDPLSVHEHPGVASALDEIEGLVAKQRRAASQFDMDQLNARFHVAPGEFNPNVVGANPHLDPLGMDELKKAIGRVVEKHGGEAEAAASRVYAALADQIKTKAPIYDKMMSRYSAMHDALRGFKKELSLGTNNPDAALKKLFSSLRANVTSTFGRKRKLVQQLAEMSPKARKSLYTLAGQYNSAWFPRGFMGQVKLGTAGVYGALQGATAAPWLLAHPLALLGLGTQSPRIMGNVARMQGTMERKLGKVPWRATFAPAAQYGSHYGSMPPWYALNPAIEEGASIVNEYGFSPFNVGGWVYKK